MHYLLTGATSGIGRAFLDLQLTQASNASASAPIFTVIARNAAKLSELATHCQPYSCHGINLDLAHPELIAPTVTEALKDLPPVDRLVYCAGITREHLLFLLGRADTCTRCTQAREPPA